jgi:hypothetical protein
MKYFISFFLLFLLAVQTKAQQADSALVEVHLINGKIIKGNIVEIVPHQFIKVKTAEQNIAMINLDEIEKVKGGKMPMDSPTKSLSNEPFEMGYFNTAEFTILASPNDFIWAVSDVNDIQLSPCSSLGIGVSMTNYYDNGFAFPVFLDFKTCFTKNEVTPFLGVDLGYVLPFTYYYGFGVSSSSGGVMFKPSLGVKFRSTRISSFDVSVGILVLPVTETMYYRNTPQGDITEEYTIPRAFLQAQFAFTF